MTTTYVSLELRSKLMGVLASYLIEASDTPAAQWDECYGMLNFILNAIADDDAEELDLEGGIECHFHDMPELRDRLLAAIG